MLEGSRGGPALLKDPGQPITAIRELGVGGVQGTGFWVRYVEDTPRPTMERTQREHRDLLFLFTGLHAQEEGKESVATSEHPLRLRQSQSVGTSPDSLTWQVTTEYD